MTTPASSRARDLAVGALWLATACSTVPAPTSPAPSEGPVILTLRETDREKGKHELADRYGIADINSALEVRVDSTALRQQVSRLVGTDSVSPEVVSRLAALQAMAIKALELVQQYTTALEQYSANKTPENLQAVRQAVKPLAKDVDVLLKIADADPALARRLDARLETFFSAGRQSVGAQYAMLLAFAGEEASSARRALDAESKKAGVRIQVGTWLSTRQGVRPISDPMLNSTAPSTPFIVDQWALALDEEQKKQFQTLAKAAEAANTGGAVGLITMLTASTRETLKGMAGLAQECAQSLTSSIEEMAGPTVDRLKAEAETLQKSAKDLVALADKYQVPATTSDPAAFLVDTNVDLVAIRTIVGGVGSAVKQIQTTLTGVSGELSANRPALKAKLDGCVATMNDEVEALVAVLGGATPAEQILSLAEDGWVEVLSFDVAQVPPRSTVDLTVAGPRRVGDIVLIRARATRPNTAQPDVLDEQRVTLQRVLPHLELSVGLVFADPLDETQVLHRFQAAPAYSVLYRRGSRRSLARNSFWNVGVGLNVAALDFDKDDVPDLGLGLTASGFSDLVQAGVGYNVFLDHPYWFFGVRLPVGVISLAGGRTPLPADAASPDQ